MSGSANRIEQIYDLKTIGSGKTISELEQIVQKLLEIERIKKRINAMKGDFGDPAMARRFTTELQAQEKALQSNVVKMNLVSEKTLKLASHNKELTLEIIRVHDEIKGATNALNDHNKAELEALQGTSKWAAEQKRLAAETAKVTTTISKETTSIASLNKENKALRKERDLLDLSTKSGVVRAQQLNVAIAENTAIIRKNQDETIKQKMNIGNYGSALTKVWAGLRQFAYILPGLGIAGIFNLIFDAIGPVIQRLFAFNNAQKEVISTLIEGRKASTAEVSELDRLYNKTQNVTLSVKDRKQAVDKLQELYPAYFKNIRDENILNGNARVIYDELRTSIIEVAKAKALQSKITEIINNGLEEEVRLTENLKKAKALEFINRDKVLSETSYDGSGTDTYSVQRSNQIRKQQADIAQNLLDDFKLNQAEQLKPYREMLNKLDDVTLNQVNNSAKDQAALEEKLERERLKAAEDRAKIVFEARIALLDAQAAEELKLAKDHEEDMKVMIGGTAEEKLLVEEGYQRRLKAIREKYAKTFYDGLFDQSLDEKVRSEKEAEKKLDGERKTQQHMLDIIKDSNKEIQAENDKAYKEAVDKQKAHDLEMDQFRKQVLNDAYNLAREYSQSQSQIKQQEIDKEFELRQEFFNSEKEKRLAQAQSAAEKQAIEDEYNKKAKESERQRNIERQEVAKKQIAIEFALASIKIWAGEGTWYTKLAQEAMLLGQYLVALQNINSQQFEQGGQVPTNTGGPITGPSHAAGGVPFNYEAEGGEMAIINKNSTMDKGVYSLTGTPRQIASAINEIGGGIRFAPGAMTRRFEYGGMLGNNLNAPTLGSYYRSSSTGGSSIDVSRMESIFNNLSSVISAESRKPVVLDTRALSKQQYRTAKQVQLGTV